MANSVTPGMEFLNWQNAPGIFDTFNAAKKGNQSAGAYALGGIINSMLPNAAVPPASNTAAPVVPGQQNAAQPPAQTQAVSQTAPQAPAINTSDSSQNSGASAIGQMFANDHPLLNSIVNGFASLMK